MNRGSEQIPWGPAQRHWVRESMAALEKSESLSGWKGSLLALALGLILSIALAEVMTRVAMPHWRDFYNARFMRHVSEPGYGVFMTAKPDFNGYFAQNAGDFRHHLRVNAFGLRNDDPVDAAEDRIWVIGDSMAFGWGVEREDTYTAVIADRLNAKTYNVAGPGNNVCGYQGLVARMPAGLKPKAAIVGLTLENDIMETRCSELASRTLDSVDKGRGGRLSLKAIKQWLTGHSALYNFVAVTLKQIDGLKGVLVRLNLVADSHSIHQAPSWDVMVRGIEATADEVVKLRALLPDDIPVAVLIVPTRFEVREGGADFAKSRTRMIKALKSRDLDTIDPFLDFRKAGFGPTHYAHDGHWTPLGHEIAGVAVTKWLKQQELP